MRKPLIDIKICKERRESLKSALKDGALILVAAPEDKSLRSPYRQESHFFALTGFEEPDAIFVFRPHKDPETVLFVREKDPQWELWNGYRFGPEGAVSTFAMDAAHSIEEFSEIAPKLLDEIKLVYYGLGRNPKADSWVQKALKRTQQKRGRTGLGLQTIVDPQEIISEGRLKKDDYSLSMMKKTTQITSEAHREVMKAVRPGTTERAMHGLFISEIMSRGATREGYISILASGTNATILHYTFNDKVMEDGELLLIDAGGEYNFFTADVTRTYPVNGRFTKIQKRLYEKVLKLQKELIHLAQPGVPFETLQTQAVEKLVDVMLSEKLLRGKAEEIIKSKEYKKYYPHRVGHWLGMDVHDVGVYQIDGQSRKLEPGMCLTIEPGIYIQPHDTEAPKELRGIGIRIEDDILITPHGSLNMTETCPKEVDELELLIGSQWSHPEE